MSHQQADVIFLNEAHRSFIETRNLDVLDRGLMYANLYRQATGAAMSNPEMSLSRTMKLLLVAVVIGILTIPVTAGFIYALTRELIENGLPHWRLMIYNGCLVSVVLIPLLISSYASLACFRQVFIALRSKKRRIGNLLDALIQDGRLAIGQVQSSRTRKFSSEITYRFTSAQGKTLEGVYYPGSYVHYEADTPVWVLYLGDKTSVLL